jgi:hypothetical protein
VDQDAAGPRREHDRELARGRGPRVEHRDRLLGGNGRDLRGREDVDELEPARMPGRPHARRDSAVPRCDDLTHEAHPRPVVFDEETVGRRDQDLLAHVGVRRDDLAHLAARRAGRVVRGAQRLDLVRGSHVRRPRPHGMLDRRRRAGEIDDPPGRAR